MNIILKYSLLLLMVFCSSKNFALADSSYLEVRKIEISGNKKTRENIILRELPFAPHSSISKNNISEIIKKSEENLINTSLFNFATITYLIDSNFIDFKIDVKERWYTWPSPIFELSDRNFNTWFQTKDFNRLNYGIYLVQENFRGRKESLKLLARMGYEDEIGLSYQVPYIDKQQKIGICFSGGYSQNHELAVKTIDNKQLFYKINSKMAQFEYNINVSLTYRAGIHNSTLLQVGYKNINISDSIKTLYPDYLSSFNENQFFSIGVLFKNDYRDYKSYPLNGHYFDLEILKKGFGILKHEANNLYIKTWARKFIKIQNKIYSSVGLCAKYSLIKTNKYFFQRGLGYGNDFVRGYEYYVVEGQNFILAKTNLKYNIIPTKIGHAKWLPMHKFNTLHYALYSNVFFDFAYSKDFYFQHNNSLNNSFLLGAGIGFDFVTYYDKVLRLEFSMNKLKEKGVFLHFMAPI